MKTGEGGVRKASPPPLPMSVTYTGFSSTNTLVPTQTPRNQITQTHTPSSQSSSSLPPPHHPMPIYSFQGLRGSPSQGDLFLHSSGLVGKGEVGSAAAADALPPPGPLGSSHPSSGFWRLCLSACRSLELSPGSPEPLRGREWLCQPSGTSSPKAKERGALGSSPSVQQTQLPGRVRLLTGDPAMPMSPTGVSPAGLESVPEEACGHLAEGTAEPVAPRRALPGPAPTQHTLSSGPVSASLHLCLVPVTGTVLPAQLASKSRNLQGRPPAAPPACSHFLGSSPEALAISRSSAPIPGGVMGGTDSGLSGPGHCLGTEDSRAYNLFSRSGLWPTPTSAHSSQPRVPWNTPGQTH